jgi:ribosomal protein S18 acetylase RimI-like enzyme
MRIREFNRGTDISGLRACLIELQDFERRLDPRMPPGAGVVDPMISEMMYRCETHDGKVFVADSGETLGGYVTVLARVVSEEADDGELEYALVSDLVVREGFRHRGIGRQLLETAEAFAAADGARWLRIEVLAANRAARDMYASFGFREHLISLEKPLPSSIDGTRAAGAHRRWKSGASGPPRRRESR